MEEIKYPILGYLFGFIGTLQTSELILALCLGFMGAFGGWLFERFGKSFLEKKFALIKKKYKEYQNNQKQIKMDNFKSTVTKILSIWVGIGTALIALGASGIAGIPVELINLFSQGTADLLGQTVDVIIAAIGTVIATAQAIRAIFVAKEPESAVSTRSAKDLKAIARSPFKI